MINPVFALPKVGRVGPYQVDVRYMQKIEARARQLEEAARPKSDADRKNREEQGRQYYLPGLEPSGTVVRVKKTRSPRRKGGASS